MSHKKAYKPTFPIDILLEDLDGYGMIVTDTDLIKERLEELGLTYNEKTIVARK